MIVSILLTILFGALAGWIAGIILKTSYSFWKNVGLGLIGGIFGGFLVGVLGLNVEGFLAHSWVALW